MLFLVAEPVPPMLFLVTEAVLPMLFLVTEADFPCVLGLWCQGVLVHLVCTSHMFLLTVCVPLVHSPSLDVSHTFVVTELCTPHVFFITV